MIRSLSAAFLLAASLAAGASEESAPFHFKPDTGNVASLQRGARDFMAYCSGCHSLKYLRYNRLGNDLRIPPKALEQNLMFTSDKPGDHILSSMPAASADWFGKQPPDLSLEARYRGADWVYSYLLSFYLDPSRPTGVNNLVLKGASMPHVLGDLQGWQMLKAAPEGEEASEKPEFEIAVPGTMKPEEYKGFAADLTNFLVYAAEPGRNGRIGTGVAVLLYLLILFAVTWALKQEYWKDVH